MISNNEVLNSYVNDDFQLSEANILSDEND